MNLISILIALAIETFYRPVQEWRRFDWFERYVDGFLARAEAQTWRDGPLGLLVVLGTVVFGVWLVEAMLDGVAALFGFLFGIAVLVYCLGPKDLEAELDGFIDAMERGDEEAACLRATALLGHDVGDNEQTMLEQVKAGLVIEANNRLFAVMLVLGFALAGSFVDTVSRWRGIGDIWAADSESLLVESGLGAIAHEPHSESGKPDLEGVIQLMALIKRTLLVWLAALALMTLTGWVFSVRARVRWRNAEPPRAASASPTLPRPRRETGRWPSGLPGIGPIGPMTGSPLKNRYNSPRHFRNMLLPIAACWSIVSRSG